MVDEKLGNLAGGNYSHGMAFTSFVNRSVTTRMYLSPLGVRISLPNMSMATDSNGAVSGNVSLYRCCGAT